MLISRRAISGGIGMYLPDIKIAYEEKLPILIVMFSDGGYGSIKRVAKSRSLGEDLLNTSISKDWPEVINGFGIPYSLARSSIEFCSALDEWLPSNGPHFIQCLFDPEAYSLMAEDLRK